MPRLAPYPCETDRRNIGVAQRLSPERETERSGSAPERRQVHVVVLSPWIRTPYGTDIHKQSMQTLTTLVTLLIGLFGGAGATLLWETVIKPRRDSRAFAKLLMTELAVNRVIVLDLLESHRGHPDRDPRMGVKLYSTIFSSSASRLADLPPDVAALSYWAYRYFDQLNEMNSHYWSVAERISFSHARGREDPFLAELRSVYVLYLEHCLLHIDKVRTAIEYASLPLWSIRRRRLKPLAQRYRAEIEDVVGGPTLESQEPIPNEREDAPEKQVEI